MNPEVCWHWCYRWTQVFGTGNSGMAMRPWEHESPKRRADWARSIRDLRELAPVSRRPDESVVYLLRRCGVIWPHAANHWARGWWVPPRESSREVSRRFAAQLQRRVILLTPDIVRMWPHPVAHDWLRRLVVFQRALDLLESVEVLAWVYDPSAFGEALDPTRSEPLVGYASLQLESKMLHEQLVWLDGALERQSEPTR